MENFKNILNNLFGDEFYICNLNTSCSNVDCYGPFDSRLEAFKYTANLNDIVQVKKNYPIFVKRNMLVKKFNPSLYVHYDSVPSDSE